MSGNKVYRLGVTFVTDHLASSPANTEVYKEYIESKRRDEAEEAGDEVATLPAEHTEKIGWSVYHQDDKGLFLFDYHIRGFLKEAASAITGKTGLSAFKSKIDKWLFVTPRRLYLMNGAGHITKPEAFEERPIRAMTAQGPRTSLKRSDKVLAGAHFNAEIVVLPLGQAELTKERLTDWFDYGKWQGLGEWRNGSFGRFDYTLTEVK